MMRAQCEYGAVENVVRVAASKCSNGAGSYMVDTCGCRLSFRENLPIGVYVTNVWEGC
jgi:hypothetical protein